MFDSNVIDSLHIVIMRVDNYTSMSIC